MLRVLVTHWELKLLALVFSGALWLFVMTSDRANVTISLPLEIHSLPVGLRIAGEQPDTVDVHLHGIRSALSAVSPESVRLRVSLAGARAGEVLVRLGPEQVVTPPGVSVLRLTPSTVRVAVARER